MRQFDINSLYIDPPYLYTVTTLPYEIQKSLFFNSNIHTDFRLLRYLGRNKMQLLYCSLSVYVLLFTASYYLHIPILWSVFISVVSHFQRHQCQPTIPARFRVTNIWRNATLPAVRCKSFTFYKVVR